MASTTNHILRSRHIAPIAARSARSPDTKDTHDIATTATSPRSSLAGNASQSGSPFGNRHNCSYRAPPLRWIAIHGYTLAGNSPSYPRITLSRAIGSTCAAMFSPVLVLGTNVISSLFAPTRAAHSSRAFANALNCSSSAIFHGSARSRVQWSSSRTVRAGSGPVAAALRYVMPPSAQGNSVAISNDMSVELSSAGKGSLRATVTPVVRTIPQRCERRARALSSRPHTVARKNLARFSVGGMDVSALTAARVRRMYSRLGRWRWNGRLRSHQGRRKRGAAGSGTRVVQHSRLQDARASLRLAPPGSRLAREAIRRVRRLHRWVGHRGRALHHGSGHEILLVARPDARRPHQSLGPYFAPLRPGRLSRQEHRRARRRLAHRLRGHQAVL